MRLYLAPAILAALLAFPALAEDRTQPRDRTVRGPLATGVEVYSMPSMLFAAPPAPAGPRAPAARTATSGGLAALRQRQSGPPQLTAEIARKYQISPPRAPSAQFHRPPAP